MNQIEYPIPNRPIGDDSNSDIVVLTALVFTEARGESDQGKMAVAEVVKNRAARPSWWGRDFREVMLRKYQFSGLSEGDPSLRTLMDLAVNWTDVGRVMWSRCWRAAWFVHRATNWVPRLGTARGADYYHATGARARWIQLAEDAGPPLIVVGRHVFYELGPDGLEGTQDDFQ